MAKSQVVRIAGLYTSYNELSEVPEGALLEARNIDILQDSIAEPRRGLLRLASGYTDPADKTDKLTTYQDKLMAHHGTLDSADTVSYFDSGTWTALAGTYSAPTAYKVRFNEASQNLYFTTSAGVKKLDAYNGTVKAAGGAKAIHMTGTVVSSSPTSTWLTYAASPNLYKVAYRVVWGYRDANDNLILGAPSQRLSLTNSSGIDTEVTLTIYIPDVVTTDWFFQVYRSNLVQGDTVEPSDELYLTYEAQPASGDITNGYVTFTDVTPEALLGATLYTSASQEGIVNGNEPPPLCRDVVNFQGHTFYVNTTSKHRFYLTLLSTDSGSGGLQLNDTIEVGGYTYTAKSAESVGSREFKLSTGGTPAQDIRDTCESIINVVNQDGSNTVYGFYLSGPDQLPGQLLFEERGLGGASFDTISSRSTCWSPKLVAVATDDSASTNDRFKNGVYISKPNQPEAVPLANFFQVGSEDDEIKRAVALRDSLFFFKEDGIYRLSGTNINSFDTRLFDSSAKIFGAETAQVLNNQIFCLSDQGVISVTETGVSVRSRPIEQDLLEIMAASPSLVRASGWGLSYEADRKYYLFLPQTDNDASATHAFVFNIFTNTWVEHVYSATCGTVSDDNELYVGDAGSNFVLQEQRNYSYLDYGDFGFATTITSVSSLTLGIGSGVDNISVGDLIYQSNTLFAHVTGTDTINSEVTIDQDPGFTVAACSVLTAIDTKITWVPITFSSAGTLKQIFQVSLLWKEDFNGTGYLDFKSDLSQSVESVPIAGSGSVPWGLFTWGSEPWGGEPRKGPIRQWVPRNKQLSNELTISFRHAYGYSPWTLQGLVTFGSGDSENSMR